MQSLEQQTATSEVLKVISQLTWRTEASIPGDAGERSAAFARPSLAALFVVRGRNVFALWQLSASTACF